MKAIFGLFLAVGLAAVPAYAARNSDVIHLTSPVKVGSTQLATGNYTVTWTGTGSNVQLTFEQRGSSPVTIAAKLTEEKHDRTGVTTDSSTGAPVLKEIELRHVTLSVVSQPSVGQ
jgi:hypothetical protein